MMQSTYPLLINENHLIASLSPGPWFIDTGSPKSFGETAVITGSTLHPVPETYRRLNSYKLRLNTSISNVGLIGCDILNQYTCVINVPRRFIQFRNEIPDTLPGKAVQLNFVGNRPVPWLETYIKGIGTRRLIFDTGAQYSYLKNFGNLLPKPIGQAVDFHILCGKYKVDLHELEVELGSAKTKAVFATEPGEHTHPVAVRKLLSNPLIQGILGSDILRQHSAVYMPRQCELWI